VSPPLSSPPRTLHPSTQVPVLFALEFLHRAFDVFVGYFGAVNARTITESFSTAFQLLEEMLDNGYPMITEPNALNSLVAPPTVLGSMSKVFTGKSAVSDTIGDGAMSIIPWRRAGVVYTANEIFFDICEDFDCIIESNGTVANFDVRGVISCTSKLSGTPDLTLIFANPSIIEDWCVCLMA
jgi:AP-3 complex subunit mu